MKASLEKMNLADVLTKKALEDNLPKSYEDQEDNDMAKEIVKLQMFKERIANMTQKVERAKKLDRVR